MWPILVLKWEAKYKYQQKCFRIVKLAVHFQSRIVADAPVKFKCFYFVNFEKNQIMKDNSRKIVTNCFVKTLPFNAYCVRIN